MALWLGGHNADIAPGGFTGSIALDDKALGEATALSDRRDLSAAETPPSHNRSGADARDLVARSRHSVDPETSARSALARSLAIR
jgi:hypothetical protein